MNIGGDLILFYCEIDFSVEKRGMSAFEESRVFFFQRKRQRVDVVIGPILLSFFLSLFILLIGLKRTLTSKEVLLARLA